MNHLTHLTGRLAGAGARVGGRMRGTGGSGDDVVRCAGGRDKVVVDARDKVATNCEVVVVKP